MPTKSQKVAPIQANTAVQGLTVNVEREHQKGLALVNPVVAELRATQVTTAEQYAAADQLLGRLRNTRKQWGTIWGAIYERVVRPQKEALDNLYAINREIDKPLEDGEKALKKQMAAFKDEERRQLAVAEQQREAEANRTQELIDQTRAKLETAKGSTKRVLENNLGRLESHQQAVLENIEMPVVASNSSDRVIKVLIVTDLIALAEHMGRMQQEAGDHGTDADPAIDLILAAVEGVLNKLGKTQEAKDRLAQWPGVGLQEQTQIVGR